jgi:hypothetical protein
MTRRLVLALSVGIAVSTVPRLAAPQTTTADILPRATTYVQDFISRFANVVAEERYSQRITSPNRRRELLSDFLLVRLAETGDWQAFRDVFEVDGKPVRDREARLTKLLLTPSRNAFQQAAAIANESARQNLADIGTLNNPLIALSFLQPRYQPRFRFLPARLDKKLGTDVWLIQFQEFVVPTILKGNANRDLPSRGRLWIEGATGRVVKTELEIGSNSARFGLTPISIATTYAFDEALGLNVPVEMQEFYPQGDNQFTSVAKYGRFRRFDVKTEETVKP